MAPSRAAEPLAFARSVRGPLGAAGRMQSSTGSARRLGGRGCAARKTSGRPATIRPRSRWAWRHRPGAESSRASNGRCGRSRPCGRPRARPGQLLARRRPFPRHRQGVALKCGVACAAQIKGREARGDRSFGPGVFDVLHVQRLTRVVVVLPHAEPPPRACPMAHASEATVGSRGIALVFTHGGHHRSICSSAAAAARPAAAIICVRGAGSASASTMAMPGYQHPSEMPPPSGPPITERPPDRSDGHVSARYCRIAAVRRPLRPGTQLSGRAAICRSLSPAPDIPGVQEYGAPPAPAMRRRNTRCPTRRTYPPHGSASWGTTMGRWGIAVGVALVTSFLLGMLAGIGEATPEAGGQVAGALRWGRGCTCFSFHGGLTTSLPGLARRGRGRFTAGCRFFSRC